MIGEMHSLFLFFVCHIWTVTLHKKFVIALQIFRLWNFKVCQNYFGYKYLCNTFQVSFKENTETKQ